MGDFNLFLAICEHPENPFDLVPGLQKSFKGCSWWLSLSFKLTLTGNLKKKNDRGVWGFVALTDLPSSLHTASDRLWETYCACVLWCVASHFIPTN